MMLWKYYYDLIDGEKRMTGWQGWNEKNKPVPGTEKDLFVSIAPPAPAEILDEYGQHRYIVNGKNEPEPKPAIPDPAVVAEKEKKEKVEKMKNDLATALVENNIGVDNVIAAVKNSKVVTK